jgi:hypothetical protein
MTTEDWPGDTTPLPHQPPVDRVGDRLAGMVRAEDRDWPRHRWDLTQPDGENGRHHRRGHILELRECDWRCLICGHWFEAASDADLFWCGNRCKHPGDAHHAPTGVTP